MLHASDPHATPPPPQPRNHVFELCALALPFRLTLEAAEATLAHKVRRSWARCLNTGQHRAPAATLHFTASNWQDPAALLSDISTRVTLEAIAQWRGARLLFHAAGLADPETGRASVLVAASGTGKTTASRVLGRSLEYLSDETVCVGLEDLSITPYPKPLSVIAEPNRPKEQVSPDELGLRSHTRPARMNRLFVLQRDPAGPVGELSDPLPLNAALELLAPNISALPAIPKPLTTLVDIIRRVGGVRVARYRDIRNIQHLIEAATAKPSVPASGPEALVSWLNPSPPVHHPDQTPRGMPGTGPSGGPAAASASTARTSARSGTGPQHARVRLAPWVEALENPQEPEQLIVLLTERLLVLAGIAPVIWHECRKHGARTPQQLREAVVEVFGENPDAADIVDDCLRNLARAGALLPA